MTAGCPPSTCDGRARQACAGSTPTTSTCTRCTTSNLATPWEEIWQAMERLVQQGKISYVGCSNSPAGISLQPKPWQRSYLVGLTSEQSLYNLAVQAIEQEVIHYATWAMA